MTTSSSSPKQIIDVTIKGYSERVIPSTQKRYVIYEIETVAASSTSSTTRTYLANRRYKEFERLNKDLEKNGEETIHLPGKLLIHSENTLANRRLALEKALRELVERKRGTLASPVLQQFLGIINGAGGDGDNDSPQSQDFNFVVEEEESALMGPTPSPGGRRASGSSFSHRGSEEMEANNNDPEDDDAADLVPHGAPGKLKERREWVLEMLVARATLRAERANTQRLARFFFFSSTVFTLVGFSNVGGIASGLTGGRRSLIAMISIGGSAATCGLAWLWDYLYLRREGAKRRGFGMLTDPLETKTSEDVAAAGEYLSKLESGQSKGDDDDNNNNKRGSNVLVTLGSSMIELIDPSPSSAPKPPNVEGKPRGGSGGLESVVSASPSPPVSVPHPDPSSKSNFESLTRELDEEFARDRFLEVFQKCEREIEALLAGFEERQAEMEKEEKTEHVRRMNELRWRLARAGYYASKQMHGVSMREVLLTKSINATKTMISTHILEEPSAAQSREGAPPPSAVLASLAHKWYAILRNAQVEGMGTKERLGAANDFESHTRRGLELNPDDGSLHYMLGRLLFDVSQLSWVERSGAKALYGAEPPKGTVPEALRSFEAAYERKQNPAIMLAVAKCKEKMRAGKPEVITWLRRCVEWVPKEGEPSLGSEDEVAMAEAEQMLARYE